MNRLRRTVLSAASGAIAVTAALALAACSGGGQAAPTQTQAAQGFAGQAGQRMPGVSGLIAAKDGTTLQVQSDSEQTAVTYTSKTTITQQVVKKLSDVKVGDCVVATTAATDASSGDSGVAATVSISEPVDGSCTTGQGFGGRGGGTPGSAPSGAPSGLPSGRPSSFPSGGAGGSGQGQGRFAVPTIGKVTAVSGSTITVDAQDFQSGDTTSKTVAVDGSTVFTATATATASALKVGKCVTARGTADDSGTVAATSLAVSEPSADGTCSTGFGRGFGGGQGGQGGQGGAANG